MVRFLLAMLCFSLAACATSSPNPDQFDSAQASEPDQANESFDNGAVAQAEPAEDPGVIEAIKAPNVEMIPASDIPGRPEPELAIVCERVIPTGSVLPKRVCRHQSEIDRKQAADQKIFDDIKRNTAIGASRL